jgi:integrase
VTMAAKSYRLLRAMLMTAVKEDELIRVNPCRIEGAHQEKPAERPVFTVPEAFASAEQMPARFRALILVLTFESLRWGEAVALQRCDIDRATGTVRVRQAFVEHPRYRPDPRAAEVASRRADGRAAESGSACPEPGHEDARRRGAGRVRVHQRERSHPVAGQPLSTR